MKLVVVVVAVAVAVVVKMDSYFDEMITMMSIKKSVGPILVDLLTHVYRSFLSHRVDRFQMIIFLSSYMRKMHVLYLGAKWESKVGKMMMY